MFEYLEVLKKISEFHCGALLGGVGYVLMLVEVQCWPTPIACFPWDPLHPPLASHPILPGTVPLYIMQASLTTK